MLAFFAGLSGLLMVGGGLVGGVLLDSYPRQGRLVGLALALYGAVGVTLAYRILRRRALVREAVVLAVWWVPFRWIDAWVNDLEHGWRWPVVPLLVLVWLLAHGLRHRPPAPVAADAGHPDGAATDPAADEQEQPLPAPRST